MKKLTLALATAALLSSAAYAQSASASGQVDFEGEVNTAPCDVVVSGNGLVKLGSYTVKSLTDENAVGDWGYQDIEFKNCELDSGTNAPKLPNVSIKIADGAADTNKPAIWKNLGLAQNVGVEIEVQGKKVTPTGSAAIDTILSGANDTVRVAGRIAKTNADPAVPGSVKTNISFVASFK